MTCVTSLLYWRRNLIQPKIPTVKILQPIWLVIAWRSFTNLLVNIKLDMFSTTVSKFKVLSQPLSLSFHTVTNSSIPASWNFDMTTGVSLPLLLPNVLEETRFLREHMANTITSSENGQTSINEKMHIMARANTGRRIRQTGQIIQKVPKASSVSKMFIPYNLVKNHQIREASHIDFVREKRHIFVSLETSHPPPP
jgi:hypothetical protein